MTYACSWCQGTKTGAISCTCMVDCGKPECPHGEGAFYVSYPVPTFPAVEKPIIEDAVRIDPGEPMPSDPKHAVTRVLELHVKCPCNGCSAGIQRPACKGCGDFWPCPTVHAVRGTAPARQVFPAS